MQTIWTRVWHSGSSCRCSLCRPPKSTVLRQATTAPVRRRNGVNDAVTIFYGTVMAAALFTDASTKIGKRRQLDRDIDKARADTKALEAANRRRLQALGVEEDPTGGYIPTPTCTVTESNALPHRSAREKLNRKNGLEKMIKTLQSKLLVEGSLPNRHEMQRQIEGAHDKLQLLLIDKYVHRGLPLDVLTTCRRYSSTREPGSELERESAAQTEPQEVQYQNGQSELKASRPPKSSGLNPKPIDHLIQAEIMRLEDQLGLLNRRIHDPSIKPKEIEKRQWQIEQISQRLRILYEAMHSEQNSSLSYEALAVLRHATSHEGAFTTARALRSEWETIRSLRSSERIEKIRRREQEHSKTSNQEARPVDLSGQWREKAPRLEMEPFPHGRTAKQLWHDTQVDKLGSYWIRRREIAMASLVAKLARYAIGLSKDTPIELEFEGKRSWGQSDLGELNHKIEAFKAENQMLHGLVLDRDRVEYLRKPSLPAYKSHKPQYGFYEVDRLQELNNNLTEAFVTTTSSHDMLSRICQILLATDVVPNIHTFNILLINLVRRQHFSLVPMVQKALEQCGITRNEITVATMLRYYAAIRDLSAFKEVVERMDVSNGRGLFPLDFKTVDLAKAHPELVSSTHWRSYKTLNKVGLLEGRKVKWVKVPRNQDIYTALIVGYLEFGYDKEALVEYNRMRAGGLAPGPDIVITMLQQAMFTRNWSLGEKLCHKILDGVIEMPAAMLREAVYIMMQMWSDCPKMGAHMNTVAEQLTHKINALAEKEGLVTSPLKQEDFRCRHKRDALLMQQRIEQIQRLEQPVLQLKFNGDVVHNLTPVHPDLIPDEQPANLNEFLCKRLALLHEQHVNKHGVYPTTICANGTEAGFLVGQAAAIQVRLWDEARTIIKKEIAGRTQHLHAVPMKEISKQSKLAAAPAVVHGPQSIPLRLVHEDEVVAHCAGNHSIFDRFKGQKWIAEFHLLPGRASARASIEAR